MSRSGFSDDGDYDAWATIRWGGQVASAIRGKRGQAFLRELVEALDALPEPVLIAEELQNTATGQVCAVGAVGLKRGVDMTALNIDDYQGIAAHFGVAPQLIQEIENLNDEGNFGGFRAPPEERAKARWIGVRAWAVGCIREVAP